MAPCKALSFAMTTWHADPVHVPRLRPTATVASGATVVSVAVTVPPVLAVKADVAPPLVFSAPVKVSVNVNGAPGFVGRLGVVGVSSSQAAAAVARVTTSSRVEIERRMPSP